MYTYRDDITGLRGIAILGVLLFHSGFDWASGGFLGVDVFFVISGYLMYEIYSNKLGNLASFLQFWKKRFWRLAPALLVMVSASSIAALLLMEPIELKRFGQSVVATLLFANNVLLQITADYFDPNTQIKPLVHTWSLGVEGQFYFLFPLLFWLRHRLIIGLALLAIASFCCWLAFFNSASSFSFYSIFCRLWILLSGALTCLLGSYLKTHYCWNRLTWLSASILGLICILVPIYSYENYTALAVGLNISAIFGACMLLLVGNSCALLNRVLVSKPLQFFGIISYSLYLWHQPILAFTKIYLFNAPSQLTLVIAVAAATAVGWLSYKFIEIPSQRLGHRSNVKAFATSIAAFAILLFGGLSFHFKAGLPERFRELPAEAKYIARSDWSLLYKDCERLDSSLPELRICFPQKGRADSIKVVIYGDSHAESLISSALRHYGTETTIAFVKNPYCHVVDTFFGITETQSKHQRCLAAKKIMHDYFSKASINNLILSIRWTLQTWPVDEISEPPHFDNKQGGIEVHPGYYFGVGSIDEPSFTFLAKKAAIKEFISQFIGLSQKVIVVGPIPEVGWDVQNYIFRSFLRDGVVPETLITSKKRFQDRNRHILTALRDSTIAHLSNLYVVLPHQVFCDEINCYAIREGKAYYFDDDHLSLAGAEKLFEQFSRNNL